MTNYPPLHIIIYGRPHYGKSTFVRTMPVPNLIFCFDSIGKDMPYLEMGEVRECAPNEFGTPITQVFNGEQLLYQIESYREPMPEQPTAFKRFLLRMASIHHEYHLWPTISFDSVTSMQMIGLVAEKAMNTNNPNPQSNYARVKETLEANLILRFGAAPMNVVVVAHEMEKEVMRDEKDNKGRLVQVSTGKVLRGVNAIGQMHNTIPGGFADFYRMVRTGNKFQLFTAPQGIWDASSSIDAPNPCEPNYSALWKNWEERNK